MLVTFLIGASLCVAVAAVVFPPTNTYASSAANGHSTTFKVSGQAYGNGIYNASILTSFGSPPGGETEAFYVFDGNSGTIVTFGTQYTIGTGLYAGSTSTYDSVTTTSTLGEWVQISIPTSIYLNQMYVATRSGYTYRMPCAGSIFASNNNGLTFTKIATFTRSCTSVISATFTISGVIQKYSMFRIVFTQRATGGDVWLSLSELTISGDIPPSAAPTMQPIPPSSQPSSQPSRQPTSQPTRQPSSHPSTQPSSQPSSRPSSLPTILSALSAVPEGMKNVTFSPTYRVINGFAFAALALSPGRVFTWGEAPYGGNSSAVAADILTGVADVVPSRFGYVVVKDDGTVVGWGTKQSMKGLVPLFPSFSVTSLVASESAYAGYGDSARGVVTFGSPLSASDIARASQINGHIHSIAASAAAFAALTTSGQVVAWGSSHTGGVAPQYVTALQGVRRVIANYAAFAALLHDGRVVTWGVAQLGGDASAVQDQLQSGVVHVIGSRNAFVAFKTDSSIVAWGLPTSGGDASTVASQLTANVTFVAYTFTAMAALKRDGSVVAWGRADGGGDASAVQSQLVNVVALSATYAAFAALTISGRVIAWGRAAYGGSIPTDKLTALSSGVRAVYATDRAFAALKQDGSVVVWGAVAHGGDPSSSVEALLTSNVHTICSNDVAFSAIKTDGSVVAWGHAVSVPSPGIVLTHSALQEGNVQCK